MHRALTFGTKNIAKIKIVFGATFWKNITKMLPIFIDRKQKILYDREKE